MAAMRAILFTQQTIGLGARKTSMIFLAQALAGFGYEVSVVTVQLSLLTGLRRESKLRAIPRSRRNRWYDADGMRGFVWVAPAHPIRLPGTWPNRLTAPLVRRYGRLLPRTLLDAARMADLVIVESCSAVALFGELKHVARSARFVYSMSDRLDAVGMHPELQRILDRDAASYDLIRVPAQALMSDFSSGNVAYIPHGLDKTLFDAPSVSPYPAGNHAVLAGDMMLDQSLLALLAERFPSVGFHYFGRTKLEPANERANLVSHGEVPFATLVPFIKHANVGLSLYTPSPDLDYLAQSSLKNLQYRYSGLPVVAPDFIARGLTGVVPYDPARPESAVGAFSAALDGGSPEPGPPIQDWSEVAATILARVALSAHQ